MHGCIQYFPGELLWISEYYIVEVQCTWPAAMFDEHLICIYVCVMWCFHRGERFGSDPFWGVSLTDNYASSLSHRLKQIAAHQYRTTAEIAPGLIPHVSLTGNYLTCPIERRWQQHNIDQVPIKVSHSITCTYIRIHLLRILGIGFLVYAMVFSNYTYMYCRTKAQHRVAKAEWI